MLKLFIRIVLDKMSGNRPGGRSAGMRIALTGHSFGSQELPKQLNEGWMHRKVRPGSRWMNAPRNTPCLPNTHLKEREQQIRQIRRNRLPGEPSGILPVLTSRPDHFLAALRALTECLQQDGDCTRAWSGLSLVFEAMNDDERSAQCRDVARWLTRPPALRAQAGA